MSQYPNYNPDDPGCVPEECGSSRSDPCRLSLLTEGLIHEGDITQLFMLSSGNTDESRVAGHEKEAKLIDFLGALKRRGDAVVSALPLDAICVRGDDGKAHPLNPDCLSHHTMVEVNPAGRAVFIKRRPPEPVPLDRPLAHATFPPSRRPDTQGSVIRDVSEDRLANRDAPTQHFFRSGSEYLMGTEREQPPNDSETVDHPAHYGGEDDPFECIKVIEAWRLGFHLGQVLKYVRRAPEKGTHVEDLKKARWYLDREIARLEEQV